MGNSAKDNVFASLKVAPDIVASSVTDRSAMMAVETAVSSVPGVSVALSPSVMCAPVLCVVAFALAARRVRLSNDVEENPGPPPGTGNDKNSNGTDAVAGVSQCIKQLELSMQQKLDTILATMQTQADTMKRQEDMLKRQEDMISRFGKEQEQLKKAIDDLGSDVTETKAEVKTNQEAIRVLSVKQNDMFDIVAELESEIDRLEGYSRRNNIKLFGIPKELVDKTENCAEAVLNVLNTYVPEKKWEPDVIERAHRLGTRNPQNR
jgi:membrane-bound lytic murein transglycosylase